jgi:hypothetical protein
MIGELALFTIMSINCPKTNLIGFEIPMSKIEMESLNRAIVHCKELYPEAPCLKSFEKRAELVYWAICTYKIRRGNK